MATKDEKPTTRIPPAQPVVDRIVAEIQGGKGAYRVAKELNADKVDAPDGTKWSRSSVETVFKKATGIRTISELRGEGELVARPTTVKLPEKLDARLRLEAKRRGLTVSELTREAIEAHLDAVPRREFLAAGTGASGRSDISGRVEEILREEWAR